MLVSIKLFASLSHYAPAVKAGHPVELELPADATVAEALFSIGLPADEAKLVFVNGRAQSVDWRLQPGDQLGIFPRIGGG